MSTTTVARYATAVQWVSASLQIAAAVRAYRDAQAYAETVRQAGKQARTAQERRTAKLVGAQKVAAIAGGVSPWQGSARDVIYDTMQHESANAAMLEVGYEIRARHAEMAGSAAAVEHAIGGINTLIGMAHTVWKSGTGWRGLLSLPPATVPTPKQLPIKIEPGTKPPTIVEPRGKLKPLYTGGTAPPTAIGGP